MLMVVIVLDVEPSKFTVKQLENIIKSAKRKGDRPMSKLKADLFTFYQKL